MRLRVGVGKGGRDGGIGRGGHWVRRGTGVGVEIAGDTRVLFSLGSREKEGNSGADSLAQGAHGCAKTCVFTKIKCGMGSRGCGSLGKKNEASARQACQRGVERQGRRPPGSSTPGKAA